MKKLSFLAVVAASVLAASCSKPSLADKTADKLCNCQITKDFVVLKKSLEGKDDAGKLAAISEVIALTQKMPTCIEDLKKQIDELTAENKTKFDKELETTLGQKCPDIAKVGVMELINIKF